MRAGVWKLSLLSPRGLERIVGRGLQYACVSFSFYLWFHAGIQTLHFCTNQTQSAAQDGLFTPFFFLYRIDLFVHLCVSDCATVGLWEWEDCLQSWFSPPCGFWVIYSGTQAWHWVSFLAECCLTSLLVLFFFFSTNALINGKYLQSSKTQPTNQPSNQTKTFMVCLTNLFVRKKLVFFKGIWKEWVSCF